MRRRLLKLALAVPFVAAIALLGLARFSHAADGGSAHDITGKFVSYDGNSGVLKVNVPHGHLKGEHEWQVPGGIPVMVYTDPNHPTMHHSPDGLQNIPANTSVQVTTDSRDFVIRIAVGAQKSKKK